MVLIYFPNYFELTNRQTYNTTIATIKYKKNNKSPISFVLWLTREYISISTKRSLNGQVMKPNFQSLLPVMEKRLKANQNQNKTWLKNHKQTKPYIETINLSQGIAQGAKNRPAWDFMAHEVSFFLGSILTAPCWLVIMGPVAGIPQSI